MLRKVGIDRKQQGKDCQDKQCNLDQMRQRIRNQHAIRNVCLRRSEDQAEDCPNAAERTEDGGGGESDPRPAGAQEQKVGCQRNQGRDDDDDFRQCELQQLRIVGRGHRQPPWRRPLNSGEFSAGTITFRRIWG